MMKEFFFVAVGMGLQYVLGDHLGDTYIIVGTYVDVFHRMVAASVF